jgi:hypothetical protein
MHSKTRPSSALRSSQDMPHLRVSSASLSSSSISHASSSISSIVTSWILVPIESLKSKAESYWRGELSDDPTHYEYLFIGDAKVLDEVRKNYSEFEAQKIGS